MTFEFKLNQIYCGDSLQTLKKFPPSCINTIITSPPYYGQRDYKESGQIGKENVQEMYIENLRKIFMECKRVLSENGTLWLNLGDKYIDTELAGLPWNVVFALKKDGWILRSDIIWHKTNAMPSSVKTRPTTDHEYLFLFSKNHKYYYNADAIREPHITFSSSSKMKGGRNHFGKNGGTPENGKFGGSSNLHKSRWDNAFHPNGRNKRTVWSIPLSKFSGQHFAVFPEKLVEPCILAASKPNEVVLDPFVGSGTTAIVAARLGRKYIGIDIVEKYCKLAKSRLKDIQKPLLL